MAGYLDPKNDLIFKKIFGEQKHILMSFLNAILPLADGQEILTLEYLSPELAPVTFLEKFSAVDVRCKDNFQRTFVVEMQMNWTPAFQHRVVFNAAKAYVSQAGVGAQYSNLKPVYALNLINASIQKGTDYFHHYTIYDKESGAVLEGLEFIFIELPKFRPLESKIKRLAVLWLRFLTEISDSTTTVSEELNQDPILVEALTYLNESSLTKEEKVLYDRGWDRICNEKAFLDEALEKGLKQGIEIGVEQGIEIGIEKGKEELKLDIIKSSILKNVPIEIIAAITNTDISVISSIAKQLGY